MYRILRKKVSKTFFRTVSIKRTVAKSFKMSLLNVAYIVIKGDLRIKIKCVLHHNGLGGYFMDFRKNYFVFYLHYSPFKIQILAAHLKF